MNYQSIFATTPRNEEELVALEKETQQLLLKTLDINFTRKRSEKLREITCVFAGFPNGFQQIKKYWENLPPDVFCSNEGIDKLLTLPDGLIVVFSSNDEESFRVYQAIANKCIERSRRVEDYDQILKEPCFDSQPAWEEAMKRMMRRDPDFICMGKMRDKISTERFVETVESGHLAMCTINAKSRNYVLRQMYNWGVSDDFTSKMLHLVDAAALSLN